MTKIKRWLIERILPVWAREELMAENEKLHEENRRLKMENAKLDAYIGGLEAGIRAQKRITINTGEVKR